MLCMAAPRLFLQASSAWTERCRAEKSISAVMTPISGQRWPFHLSIRGTFLYGLMDREDQGRRIGMGKAEAPELKMQDLQGCSRGYIKRHCTPIGIAFHSPPVSACTKRSIASKPPKREDCSLPASRFPLLLDPEGLAAMTGAFASNLRKLIFQLRLRPQLRMAPRSPDAPPRPCQHR
jgi:hypothetical protein